jgi:hypothetical protein
VLDPVSQFLTAFSTPASFTGSSGVFRNDKVGGGGSAGVGSGECCTLAFLCSRSSALSPSFNRTSRSPSSPLPLPQSLLSYVFTNPPPDTLLNAHDLVYVLRAGSSGADDDADM